MRVEPLSVLPPKMERPVATGAANSAAVENNLLSNNPEIPVQPVSETEKPAQSASSHSETVWLEAEHRTVYRVLDQQSGDVIAQIPSDEVLRVSRNLEALNQPAQTKAIDIKS